MKQLINEPPRIPFLLRIGIWISEKIAGKRMIPARLLAWSPRLALGAAFFESLVVQKDPTLSSRLLKLVRMQVSLNVSCPFCIDMNSANKEDYNITWQEIKTMQGDIQNHNVESLSSKERLAMELANRVSQTPPTVDDNFSQRLKTLFSEREILVLLATAAQVNYWARLIQTMGIAPVGYSDDPKISILQKLM
ncbi:MAG: carboxymuconolactone decarboxylase family protein [Proteobacteria bacterium]|nr:carboxymuconolactone decarboxylase family protein [Pseudomonadota bacterium]